MTEDFKSNFHSSLDDLDDQFTAAGLRIVDEMPRLVRGFLGGTVDVVPDARQLAEDVGEECRAVEDRGFVLLARHQPVGRDLRRLVAMLRMCVDVDRSSALLRHFVETLRIIDPREFQEDLRTQLEELSLLATDVYRGGMDAWRTKDALAVNELDRRDEKVDELQRHVLETAASRGVDAEARVVMGLVARYLERIADHGVAIARDTAFVATGERVLLPSKVG